MGVALVYAFYLAPIGAFAFVFGALDAIARIRRNEEWRGPGVVAALGFAMAMFSLILVLAMLT